MSSRISDFCRMLEPDLVRFTRQLVRIRSLSGDEERVARRVQDRLDYLEYDLVLRDEVGNVVGVLAGSTDGPTLLLCSPMDTPRPPPPRAQNPSSELTSGGLRRGRIYGVGAASCKGPLASQIYGGHVLQQSFPFFRGNLVVAATVAENDGYSLGTAHLLRRTLPKLGLMPTAALLGEPTDLGLCRGCVGSAEISIRISGADEKAVRLAAERLTRGLASKTARRSGRAFAAHLHVSDPFYTRVGGTPSARLDLSCRVPEHTTIGDCVRWIRSRTRSATESDARLRAEIDLREDRKRSFTGAIQRVARAIEPWSIERTDPLARRARQALLAAGWDKVPLLVRGRNTRSLPVAAGSVLAHDHGIPTLAFGPGGQSAADSKPVESVAVSALLRAVQGTAAIAGEILTATPVMTGVSVFAASRGDWDHRWS